MLLEANSNISRSGTHMVGKGGNTRGSDVRLHDC